jgi:hypothetical protein
MKPAALAVAAAATALSAAALAEAAAPAPVNPLTRSVACSRQAEARGLRGEARWKFRAACMKGA